MSVRIIVNGARGKMGSLACEAIKQHPDFELVAALTREDNLKSAIGETKAQIVVDLTRADCVFENARTILENGAHPVIGTSGLMDKHIDELTQLAKTQHLGGIIAPNFSIAAVLMMRFAAQAARFFPEVEIIEAHHPQKFDAPSGTALKTAEMIANARRIEKKATHYAQLVEGVRGGCHHGITIHSLRLPGIVAKQDIVFGGQGETLTITHNSIDRASFMPGVLLCCEKVRELDGLYYGLEHLLEA